MKKLYLFTLILLVGYISPAISQSYFQEVYKSSPYNQEGQDVLAVSDGGYLIAGYTTNSQQYDRDILLIKTNSTGKEQWRKTYGGNKPDFPYHMLETTDGNYFLIGYSQSFRNGDYDIYLLKIKPTGTLVWQKTYGGAANDFGMDIIKTNDGNYLIVGSTNSVSYDDQDAYLIKINSEGNILWEKTYGGNEDDFGNSVIQTSSGSIVMLGQTFSGSAQNGDAYLLKLDQHGDTTWTKRFGGSQHDDGIYLTTSSDGGYVFVVRDSSNAGKDVDIRVIKTNSSGTIVWNKVYGGDKKDTPKMIQCTSDGGFVIAGHSRSFGWINPDMWILKCNSNGDTVWTRHFGGPDHEHCYVTRQLPNGSYIAVGKTESYGPDFDPIFLKISQTGTMTVGIEDELVAEDVISIYPNPTNGPLTILPPEKVLYKLTTHSNTGQMIESRVAQTGASTLDLGGYDAGLYIITMETDQAVIRRRVLVVK